MKLIRTWVKHGHKIAQYTHEGATIEVLADNDEELAFVLERRRRRLGDSREPANTSSLTSAKFVSTLGWPEAAPDPELDGTHAIDSSP